MLDRRRDRARARPRASLRDVRVRDRAGRGGRTDRARSRRAHGRTRCFTSGSQGLERSSPCLSCSARRPSTRIALGPLVASRVAPNGALLARLRAVLPEAHVLPIGTSAHVGGARECEVEAMEGFGVLRACELAGVPAVELRAISNAVDEPDRTKWRFDEAFELLGATPRSTRRRLGTWRCRAAPARRTRRT